MTTVSAPTAAQVWRVLVIDDSPDDRAEVRRLLLHGSERRYKLAEAETGAAGVRAVLDADDLPDCVVLDYNLPDMDAVEVLAALAGPDGQTACPVVVLTGTVDSEHTIPVLRAGAQDYVGKGWMTPESLTRAVENAAERWAMARELHDRGASLREMNQQLQMALSVGRALTFTWDIPTNEVRRLHGIASYLDATTGRPDTFEKVCAKVHPDDRNAFEQRARLAMERPGVGYTSDYRVVAPDGSVRWISDTGRLEFSADGKPLRLVGLSTDVTERKRAEQKLADRTELLNGVLEGTTDVIFAKDRNGRLVLANAAFAAAARFTPEQIVGKTDDDWFPPDVAAAARQQDEAVIASGSPMQFEDTVPVGGEARQFLTLKAPLRDGSNRVVGVLGIGRDITKRKLNELNLTKAIAAAEKANRAKSDFLSSMSHELRTPLNAILGFAQLLESGAPALTPDQRRNVAQILQGGWYLLELINEILDLALIESGKLSLTLEPVSLAEVMRECRAMFEPQARQRGVTMTFPSFDVDGYVRADRTRVKQVLINLLSNAIKYNKAQGAVYVEWTLSPPDSIRLSVRDTGEGLAPEKLAQLFQPFNRLGKEAGAEEGTGIGLVMAKRLVELMGGAVGAQSVVGAGSVFWVELMREKGRLPAPRAAERPAGPQAAEQPGAPLRTLLYIEDSPDNVMLFEALMANRQDIRLLTAMDGQRGIELARAAKPDVILMDIRMPGMSGTEALGILREDPSTASIPVIALSANAMPADIQTALALGFARHLTKPIDVNQLTAALDAVLKTVRTH